MASMNLLGFSLSPQEQHVDATQEHSQSTATRFGFNPNGISSTDVSEDCFDITSHHSTAHSLNLPPFGIYEAFNRNSINTSQDWKENYCNQNLLLGTSGSNQNLDTNLQHPKLENFLGGHTFEGNSATGDYLFSSCSLQLPPQPAEASAAGSGGGGNSIGLSMIKTWLRNQPPQPDNNNNNKNNNTNDSNGVSATPCAAPSGTRANSVQTLSLSMSTGSQSQLNMVNVGAGKSCSSDNKKPSMASTMTLDTQTESIETVPRKSIDTFGQRTSIYRGVTRHRWTGRYEAHLWDNSCRREGQTRKGRQGGYDKEEKAARSYDLAALKYWGSTTTTNFPISNYEKELEEMKHMTRQEYVASLRRKSSGFSRGASIYRGVTRHHQHGRWQARIGRVAGNKDLYLGTFGTQEEAAEAYDIAAIKFRGLNAVTNFDMNRYDVKSILDSTTLPIGAAAKRLKDMEQVDFITMDSHSHSHSHRSSTDEASNININSITSHLTDQGIVNNSYGASAWPTSLASFQQQPNHMQHYLYNGQRLWCKQEQDHFSSSNDHASHNFHDLQYQLQLGNNNTHNFFQANNDSGLHSIMCLDSTTSIDNGYGDGGGGYMIPMGTIADDGNHNQRNNSFGDDNEVKRLANYESVYGSSDDDPYHARNLYYLPQQQSSVDQGSACNTWVPTSIPTRPSNMALFHGASSPFTILHE
ncbi:hypothetical protein TanjilG_10673 [Lupinus angustifolius]|uniref:AP2/ERF domain-containing protein n=1 Tax=Lupinus angustifolius TaxID=3871 RepID=A0A394DFV2_LUPAN|nr:hypothetical protein TanjilG_10673 [Lupinus angustifolius]